MTSKNSRFWQNVVLIALAHVALILGLIRWSVAARASSNPESIVWLGSAEDLAAGELESEPSAPATAPPVEPKPPKHDEAEEEKPVVTASKSEIELPSPTPKPTASPTPKPKATVKPLPKPTPKKTLVTKASPKSSAKARPTPAKSSEKPAKNEKSLTVKTGAASQSSSGKTGSMAKGGNAGGGSSASEFGWYGHMLHDRFYSAWIQPTTNVPSGSKISTLVKVRIEKDGRVSKFEVIKPSENIVVNESVAAIGKRISEVDPPPAGLATGDYYDVKINFELNTDQTPAK